MIKILSKIYHTCVIIILKSMYNFFHTISSNLQTIVENGGYFLLFIITIIEGIPIIGQLVPGQTIVVISGFLSKIGILNLFIIIPIVSIGALLGDIIGFFLGKKYGMSLLERFGPYFFLKKVHSEKILKLVKEHKAKAIILGKYNPITRTLTPFMLGASGIHTKIFWIWDFIGVTIWSISSVLVGYIFGASYHLVSAVLGKYIFIAIVIGVLIAWGYRFINRQFHIFAKYELITLFFNLFGLYLFFKTIQDALTDKVFLLELDLYINNFLFENAELFITNLMIIATNIFSPTIITLASTIIILYFLYKKNFQYSLIAGLSLGGGYLFTFLIKNIVMRARPENSLLLVNGYSFPSGHAVAATIFFTLLIYFFIIKIKSMVWREILIVVSVLSILLTAFTRVYLGVHWLSDVLAGIGLGLFWVTSVILLFKYISMIISMVRKIRK